MEEFAERMLERTRKRQELLTSSKVSLPKPLSPSAVKSILPSTKDILPSIESLSSTPSARISRRNRLAELSSRVDLWLANEGIENVPKLNKNDSPDTLSSEAASIMEEQFGTNKEMNMKLTFVPSCNQTTASVEKLKLNNTNILQDQKSQNKTNVSKFQQLQKPDNGMPPQWQSPNLAAATLTVAQRRALFEKNIAATQQQNIKPITTTTVTITLSKTTDNIASATTKENISNEITTPPRHVPCKISTPPLRCGTRPPAMAAAANSDFSPKKQHPWTPPCIKNVLLKKRLINELDDEQVCDNDTVAATSSPISSSTIPSADHIAMSVGEVQYMPSSPNGGLYPDLSLIEDNSEKEIATFENQSTGLKRRSNGSSALNTSSISSESISEIDDDKMFGVKRSRNELTNIKIVNEHITTKNSPIMSAITITTPSGGQSSSMLSSHAVESPMSQVCTSFVYHQNVEDHPNHLFDLNNASLAELKFNKAEEPFQPDVKNLAYENCINEFEPSNHGEIRSPCMESKLMPLVHTVSTYRKQQQQLRLGGTPKKQQIKFLGLNEEYEDEEESSQTLFQRRMQLLDDDDEEYKLQEIEAVAERARYLERTVVTEQDRIIDQATQALNICEVYRQKNGLRTAMNSNFSPEHVHAERLLLIAGLRRTDAVREAQRLRVEHTLLPSNNGGRQFNHLKVSGNGKTLVIDSLRVPILSAVFNGGNNIKSKHNTNEGMENLTRWPGGYRYFVCAIRAVATAYRPPVTAATRPVDAVEETLLRFSLDNQYGNDETGYGYVEFITKKQKKSSGSRKCPMPSESQGAPIMICGLDDGGWKITVELYGLPQVAIGEYDHSNNGKEHDGHENRSVLDKLWSTVTTPNKEFKKHHVTSSTAHIDSPKGSTVVRNTVFRQLGYFVFSDGQVDRQQFTLNKVHQSGGLGSTSKTIEETVRVHMTILDNGEEYIYDSNEDGIDFNYIRNNKCVTKKLLKLPSECKVEGFLTLFDDHELRATNTFEQGQQWQRYLDIGGRSGGTTLWRRLWFRVEVIDDPKQMDGSNNDVGEIQNNTKQKTIVLCYWMYPEHAEQQREPLGTINLLRCLPSQSQSSTYETTVVSSENQKPDPAAPAHPDLCARPNTLRLILYSNDEHNNDIDNVNEVHISDTVDDPLLLSADTANERREWCDTINKAVYALGKYREQIRLDNVSHLNQVLEEEKKQQYQSHEQQRTGLTNPIGSTNNFGKKKKFFK